MSVFCLGNERDIVLVKESLGLLGATPVNRRRVGQEIFPCFEVRRHKGDSPRYGHCKNKGGLKALPFSRVKAWPDFQRTCTSTAKYFFRFVRSWKIVGQFLHQTMVDQYTVQKLGQFFTHIVSGL
jgi:hypothetical protein